MAAVESVHARQILDSRGNPTVEVELTLAGGARGRAAVPSGASTGEFEATELRDGGEAWNGKGVSQAVANVNSEIAEALRGEEPSQEQLDRTLIELDGTENKSRLGANAILGVSLAYAKASSAEAGEPLWRFLGGDDARVLPVPMMNVLNGGAHADNRVDFQEFMVVPAGAESFSEALRVGTEVFHALKRTLARARPRDRGRRRGRLRPRPRLERRGARGAGLRASRRPATSPAATFSSRSTRRPARSTRTARTRSSTRGGRSRPRRWPAYWAEQVERFPIVSIEDGMDEEDWDGWKLLTERIGERCQLVGDDLFVTNPERLRRGIELGVANSILIKVNQIGTLTETLEAIRIAREAGYTAVMSHRSGETEDTTIADLAVATGVGQIKTGRAVALGPRRQVQPAPADRGGARRAGDLSRPERFRRR